MDKVQIRNIIYAVAKAAADKQANDARVEAETAIAEQNNALEIKKQELKKQ